MISEDKYKKLVTIFNSVNHAPLYFEELSLLKSAKPNIDIERRRMSINLRHHLKLPRESANDFFSELESLKLGTLTIIRDRGQGNSKFKWTEVGDDVSSMAKEVLKRASNNKSNTTPHNNTEEVRKRGSEMVLMLPTGRVLRLTIDEITALKNMLSNFSP